MEWVPFDWWYSRALQHQTGACFDITVRVEKGKRKYARHQVLWCKPVNGHSGGGVGKKVKVTGSTEHAPSQTELTQGDSVSKKTTTKPLERPIKL